MHLLRELWWQFVEMSQMDIIVICLVVMALEIWSVFGIIIITTQYMLI